MMEVVRRLCFSAGHRVYGHEGKCRAPHGHNYVAHFHAKAKQNYLELDELGRVIDFGVLKDRIGGWIETNWDHAMLYWCGDHEMHRVAEEYPGWKWCSLPNNPTAENLAAFLLHTVCPPVLDGTDVFVYRVMLEETENCRATATLSGEDALRISLLP